jgi:hypothetical protein
MSDPTVSSLSRFDTSGSQIAMNSANRQNPRLLAEMVASGYLTEAALNSVPDAEIVRAGSRVRQGQTPLGTGARTNKRFRVNPSIRRFVPNTRYNAIVSQESRQSGITGEVELVEGIPLGTFMGGTARRVDIESTPVQFQNEILRYLTVQAEALKAARSQRIFNRNRITVEEGVYRYQDTELENEGDLASLASKGRAIGYVVKDYRTGTTNREMTFQLAEYFSTYPWHDKVLLDYHNYSTEDVGMRVFLILPELDASFNGTWGRTTETQYNGRVQSQTLVYMN